MKINRFNVLELITQGFGLEDSGATIEFIDISLLKLLYPEMVMTGGSYGEMEKGKLNEKGFHKSNLKPQYRLLCDLVQKVFLSHSSTYDIVTPYKFRIMVAMI